MSPCPRRSVLSEGKQFPSNPPPKSIPTPISPSHIIEDHILPAGQLHLLAGPSGAGKTAWLSQMLALIMQGAPVLGHPTNPPPFTGVIVCDRTWDDHEQWFTLSGIPDIPHYSLVDDYSFHVSRLDVKENRVSILHNLISKWSPPKGSLIIVDPAALFLGGDLLNYDLVFRRAIEIGRFCKQKELTIVGLMHAGKQKGDPKSRYTRPQDRIAGSTALLGCTGTQMYLADKSETDSPYAEFTWTPHHAASETFKMKRTNTGLFEVVSEFDSILDGEEGETKVLATIPPSGAAVSTPQILKECIEKGLSRTSIFRHLVELKGKGIIDKVGRGAYKINTPADS